jgi:NTE family protein
VSTKNECAIRTGLVLSGGLGLGAYQAGAFEELARNNQTQTVWIAGSSVGAVNGALIAGSPPVNSVSTLHAFWSSGNLWSEGPFLSGHVGHAQNWMSAFYTRLFGAAGHFRPRIPNPLGPFRSLYDLTPMRERLARLVDFGRVNSGDIRLSVAATDIETGELVIFDTAKGDRLTLDHLMASCGFLPEFAPVEIGGRLLGDGGLSANAPVEAFVREKHGLKIDTIVVIDLFTRDGARPQSLEEALARKNDLMFGNQTLQRLEAHSERLGVPAVYLSYRPSNEEAGPEKIFDLSRKSIEARWSAGVIDMKQALRQHLEASPKPRILIYRHATENARRAKDRPPRIEPAGA